MVNCTALEHLDVSENRRITEIWFDSDVFRVRFELLLPRSLKSLNIRDTSVAQELVMNAIAEVRTLPQPR